ncbi:MAG TPA: LPS-assembly protein LptD [Thauera sp.]|nr:LPS-assembly protein LptD [Thauera sp.]
MHLNTRVRLIPLLLCWMSGTALATGLPPLLVSPDLVRASKAVVKPAPTVQQKLPPASSGQSPSQSRSQPPSTPPGTPSSAPVKGRVSVTQQPAEAAQAPVRSRAVAEPAGALPAGSTSVKALRILGARSVELVADGDAELQRDDILLTADRVTYREPTDEAIAEGNVELRQGEDTIAGPKATLVIGESTGTFESPAYQLKRQRQPNLSGEAPRAVAGSGQADLLRLEGENQYRLQNATWTTCEARDPDWYIKARELELDYDREVGTAHGGSIVFMDTPIFWMPWAEFPLTGQRQSGLLPPTFGSSNKTGIDLTVPYYWNIAPNYDATVAPRFMGRRGVQLAGQYRYLGDGYKGDARVEWMPNDKVTGEDRTLASFQHQQRITPALYGSLDLNSVSDDAYFEDLSSRISVASRVHLLREGRLYYTGADWWNVSALVQSYQTLNPDPDSITATPYRRLPQLLLGAYRPDLPAGLVFDLKSEFVRFAHPDERYAEADRLTAYPQLSLPLQGAAWFLTPKAGFHASRYAIDRPQSQAGKPESISRNMPIMSIDSGLFFERDTTLFGSDFVQTLEPRLFYLRVPGRDQRDIPLFDTTTYTQSFAEIFSENRFSGGDRIGDANDLTAAVTTRLIDPETGAERLRALVGQRYYFSNQEVALFEGQDLIKAGGRTDVLAGLGGRVSRTVSIDSYLQYNTDDGETQRFNATMRYQPAYAQALNLSYRYGPNVVGSDGEIGLEDVDVSGQWPIGRGWYGVGRVTRSLKEGRVTEAIGGLEYDGGCWAFRVAMHRFAIDREDVSKAIYVQLELNDLAGIGSNPLSLITRSVPGYGKINDSSADRVFGFD